MEISKTYNPKSTEAKWYKFWLENGYFKASPNEARKPFTIVIPLPNVTDVLHMGHALNATIQDIFTRWRRMQGFEAEWLPGTDHAGIATQVIVERELLKDIPKEELGREKFVELVWEWVGEKKNTILEQLKELGCSCDWDRTRFTLDPNLSQAVNEAFIRLYKKGLIYKGDYIVNWCPRCETAIADEEVEHEELNGKLYYIKYPIKTKDYRPKTKNYVVVATTRPETMLGDTACAINPKDKKNAKFIGETAILPLIEREIPIIPDSAVDPNFGTGIVKVTPAHDPADFEIAERHDLPKILIMDTHGVINESGGDYSGLSRFEAREKIILDLKKLGLFVKTTSHRYSVGHCYRCKTLVEPLLSKQWFVKQKELAKPAIEAVERGEIKFYPDRWKGVYLNWMYNIKDWCISRQIWWGHRIPVWYCKEMRNAKCKRRDGSVVSIEKPEICPYCNSKVLFQDPDVLDTWFSSWLWPFSVFGWPKETEDRGQKSEISPSADGQKSDLDYFYPTSLLTTASEIIFFWVARMIMAGYEFMGKAPFKDVYIHGTVRDSRGVKMSKSLGNGIDPREIIKDYGTDALRFSLITTAGEGQDPRIAPNTFESGRNFTNKIWNAYRLITSLSVGRELPTAQSRELPTAQNPKSLDFGDRWILARQQRLIKEVTKSLSKYRLQGPLMQIYDFFWHEFCDWYLEIIKLKKTQGVAIEILHNTLKLLHPFMPFITEEIWQKIPHQETSIMISHWPSPDMNLFDETVESEFELIKSIIVNCRNTRADLGIPKTKLIKVLIRCTPRERLVIEENELYIQRLGKTESPEFTKTIPKGCGVKLTRGVEIFFPMSGIVDLAPELKKLESEYIKVSLLLKNIEIRLASSDFLSKAPSDVIRATRDKAALYEQKLTSLKSSINLIKHQLSSDSV